MSRIRVKICGITRIDDALAAVDAGADALGFVFYKKSPRYISPEAARLIIQELPPFISSVGLFVNEIQSEIERCLTQTRLDVIQFHGDELESFCNQFDRPYIKAVRVKTSADIENSFACYATASGILLDTYVSNIPGGTGVSFDWSLIPQPFKSQIILAGGLNPDNIAAAIKSVRPYAVDVSGGVEKEKGIKDHLLISRFVKEVGCA